MKKSTSLFVSGPYYNDEYAAQMIPYNIIIYIDSIAMTTDKCTL